MLKLLAVLIMTVISVQSHARVCAPLFGKAQNTKTQKGSKNSVTGFFTSVSSLSSRPLFVDFRSKDRGATIEITYGDFVFGGFTSQVLKQVQKASSHGQTVTTYVFTKNGTDYVTLDISNKILDGASKTVYQLRLKSEIVTPSHSERVYKFSSEDGQTI